MRALRDPDVPPTSLFVTDEPSPNDDPGACAAWAVSDHLVGNFLRRMLLKLARDKHSRGLVSQGRSGSGGATTALGDKEKPMSEEGCQRLIAKLKG